MNEWKEYTVEEISSDAKYALSTGPFGSAISSKFFKKKGVPVIRGGNLSPDVGKRLNDDGLVFLAHAKAEGFQRSVARRGDLVFTCWGTINQVGFIDGNSQYAEYVVSNKQMKWTPDPETADAEFLYYLFSGPDKQSEILNNGIGAAVPGFNLGQLRSHIIRLPLLAEQKAIAQVLSSLDDKIDLLHRQNKTLEAIAEILFRQWFIEEPEDSWEEQPLSTSASFLNGLACQKFPPNNDLEKLPVLKIRELKTGIGNDCDYATTDVDPKYIVDGGDVIFAWSASLMVKIWNGRKCVLNQHLFKVTSEKFPKWFYYYWCKFYLKEFIAISQAHATTMGHIKRGDLDKAMVLVPPADELKDMHEKMSPILSKVESNDKKIRTLEKLRDTLLPKLMSGEVRVKLD